MGKRQTVMTVSTALAALIAPAAAPQLANATATPDAHTAEAGKRPQVNLPVGGDLMSFTVRDNADGIVVAEHTSHASHASHTSHASHASSRF